LPGVANPAVPVFDVLQNSENNAIPIDQFYRRPLDCRPLPIRWDAVIQHRYPQCPPIVRCAWAKPKRGHIKYHASCYLTHAPINAAQLIRGEHRFDPNAIEEVEVRVHPSLFSICNIQEPKTWLEGKFSLRATTAMALLGEDTSDLATFSDEKVTAPAVISLRDRVKVVAAGKTRQTQAMVQVKSNGHAFHAESDSGKPAADLELQRDNLTRKFIALASPILGRRGAEASAHAARDAEKIKSADELMRFTRAA
jgi:2-methylcitrate dehydratase PrpD